MCRAVLDTNIFLCRCRCTYSLVYKHKHNHAYARGKDELSNSEQHFSRQNKWKSYTILIFIVERKKEKEEKIQN